MKEYLTNQIEEKTNIKNSRLTQTEEQENEELLFNFYQAEQDQKAEKREKMRLYKEALDEQVRFKVLYSCKN
jgi:hypothetical protein